MAFHSFTSSAKGVLLICSLSILVSWKLWYSYTSLSNFDSFPGTQQPASPTFVSIAVRGSSESYAAKTAFPRRETDSTSGKGISSGSNDPAAISEQARQNGAEIHGSNGRGVVDHILGESVGKESVEAREIRFRSSAGHACVMCQLPKFCISSEGVIQFPLEAEPSLMAKADRSLCRLTRKRRDGGEDGPFLFKSTNPSSFEFADLGNKKFLPNDALNIVHIGTVDSRQIRSQNLEHIPHYLEKTIFDAWRMQNWIESRCEAKVGAEASLLHEKSFLPCGNVSPVLFYLNSERARIPLWFEGFHNMLREVHPSLKLVDSTAFPQADESAMCFRSAFSSHCHNRPTKRDPFLEHFWRKAQSSLKELAWEQQSNTPGARGNNIQVIFLTREGHRALAGIDEMQSAVLASLGVSASEGVSFSVERFENKTFMQQLVTMRKADVLVTAHGAGAANTVFMREGSHVIEVLVFGMPYASFSGYAGISKTHYASVTALPDSGVVLQCADDRREERFKQVWKRAASTGDNVADLSSEVQCPHCMRECMRMQTLRPPSQEAGEKIVAAIQELRGEGGGDGDVAP